LILIETRNAAESSVLQHAVVSCNWLWCWSMYASVACTYTCRGVLIYC